MTRWLVTGAAGQLGTHVVQQLRDRDADVVALTRAEFDITDATAAQHAIDAWQPDVVVNAAAYTAVDAAEDDEHAADQVNHCGPRNLAAALAHHPAGRLIQISTDYVFAGDGAAPYDVESPIAPGSAYGRTKAAGEQAVLSMLPDRAYVVRTAWVYGGPGPNFLDTVLGLEARQDTLTIVDDQIGCPTYVDDLAAALIELGLSSTPAGVLHYVNRGQASWFEFAQQIFTLIGADAGRVLPTTTAAFPRPARRPAWSVLSTRAWEAAGLPVPRTWQDALADAIGARQAGRAS